MPASAKRYARMQGLPILVAPRKENLFVKATADLVNGGKTRGFKSKDVSVQEAAKRVVDGLIDG